MNESTDPALLQETSQAPSSGGLSVHIAQKSDVGLVRSENQDFAIVGISEDDATDHVRGKLMLVADGMGGHRGGATASRLAATIIKAEYLSSSNNESVQDALRQALESANSKIFDEAQSNPDLRGMGTTCSALVIRDGIAFVAHVGDSRIYLVRGDEVRQLTQDHSLVASMVREGLLTAKEAEVHPRRNVLQRSMGVAREVEIDVSAPLELKPLDTFILCSDGLHGLVKEDEMREVVRLPIEEAAREFVQRAISRGAPDNVTVIVARVEGTVSTEQSIDSTKTITGKISIDSTKTITDKMAPLSETVERPLSGSLDDEAILAKTVEKVAAAPASTTPGTPETARRSLDVALDWPMRDAKTVESPRPEPEPAAHGAQTAQPAAALPEPIAKRSSAARWIVIILLTLVAMGAAVMIRSYQNGTGIFRAEEPLKNR